MKQKSTISLKQSTKGTLFTLIMLCVLYFMGGTSHVNAQEAYVVFDNGTMTFRYDNNKPKGAYNPDQRQGTFTPWYTGMDQTTEKVVFDPSFANYRPSNCSSWFLEMINLKTIEGIENLNTSEVKDMSNMFRGCWNLHNIDVSRFDTRKVTNMMGMFYECYSISSLDLSHFNTTNVTNMFSMFAACYALAELDLSSFNTTNVFSMSGMFESCKALKSLNLTGFNTDKVTNMSYMFYNCKSLSTLDLSTFYTNEVTDMSGMFCKDSTITTIFASERFVTDAVNNGDDMFKGCIALSGAIAYDNAKTNYRYANYTNGYFTYKDPTEIALPSATQQHDTESYYDLQGRSLKSPQRGLNIVRKGNKTYKVLR